MWPNDDPDLAPDATAAVLVRHALQGPAERLRRHAPGAQQGDIEDVHRMRVATRRLRSHLRTFKPLLDEAWAEQLHEELGWLADQIGHVRDADVVLAWLDGACADAAVVDHVQGTRAVALQDLGQALQAGRYKQLLEAVDDAAASPHFAGDGDAGADRAAAEVAPELVRKAWRRMRRAVKALPPDPSDAALHKVRIRAKRCRYAAEAVEPVVGRDAGRFADAVAKLQGVLGEHQDTVLAESVLRDAAAEDPQLAPAVTPLIARLHRERHDLRARWPKVWKAAAKKPLRRWLRADHDRVRLRRSSLR